MQIKSVEIVGFKSFAERTLVEFKGGITGVVGPNGCGKSNVVDALRWCLGEMSARSLRSKQMLDVIFAGSAGRSPMSMAEVTITFDNSHKLLPIDYTEVQLTRRLFRSGESEYYINKTQCRLKDIRDLLMDTGLGEGYSILAQGEVDFVINAKPEERRELFEEAAGITKYKARREETLRKLEKVETDLSRLNDIITLVREQMEDLEAAAKKAKTYQKIKEDLKVLEITDFLNQLKIADEKCGATQTQVDQVKEQMQQATIQLDVAEADWTKLRVEQDDLEQQLYKLNTSILELDKNINNADQTLKLAQEREQEYQQKQVKCAEQIATFQKELESVQSKLASIEQEISNSSTQVQQYREVYEKEKAAWKALEEERHGIESARRAVSDEIYRIAGELNQATNDKNKFSSLLFNREVEMASTKKELEKAAVEEGHLAGESERLNQVTQEFAAAQGNQENEFRMLQEVMGRQEQQLKQLEESSTQTRHRVIQRETQIQSLEENFESSPYRKGTQAILRNGFPGLRGLVGLLFKYPEHMSTWIETALGSRVNALVFQTENEAAAALQWLKDNGLGRAHCIILEKIPNTPNPEMHTLPNGYALFSAVQCDPDLQSLRNFLLGGAVVAGQTLYDHTTLDGGADLVSPPGTEGAATDADRSHNQFLLRERWTQELNAAREELARLEADHARVRDELAGTKSAFAEKQRALDKTRVEKAHAEQLLAKTREQLDFGRREMEVLRNQIELNEKDRAEFAQSIELNTQKIADLQQRQQQKEQERDQLAQQIEAKRLEEHQRELVAKESEVRLETFQAQLDKTIESMNEWKRLSEEYRKNIADTEREAEDSRRHVADVQKVQHDEGHRVQELQQQKAQVSAQAEELIQKVSGLEARKTEMEASLHTVRDQQRVLSENAHALELELRTAENDRKNVVQRLSDHYQITPEEAAAQYQPQEVDAEEIARLRKRVDSMSNSVNLEAPEQYQSLESRFTFLNTQIADLQKAKEDLKSAIHQINTTTREQFRETFYKVRDNFRTIFSHLFVGGVADLVFTDEQNILETGIDIVAQPAGKKLQNMALLSGGEKTLTAVSLLFAFFMVKPSPICVMDEVDAPLDVVNVGRYLTLLKDFSQKTQFLVVTHNSRTMEAADILYGVTMEENGVSKILSARLKKEAPRVAEAETAPA